MKMSTKKRPVLKELIFENTTDVELFQNKTLRPIIKMQHEVIVIFFKNCLLNRKIKVKELKERELLKIINNFFSKDNKFRNQLLGIVVGQFSVEEFQYYIKYSSEIHKRIVQIILQRLKDSIQEIIL